ncbi:hypothetical protein D0N36_04315 [Hymenobacter lapidiphilus]|uniref:hypothetical protein n=1 Tax=Hymenobacter sp. CCM 8763 TaxID=2303334 RepID=UPI000E34CEB4|nr:hypothetical protein [Hymenobacter sp. CCM 8763]RFP66249.1 hypothetical protein D0N36_04315 [Hymenobacter sp. CCM 8763]
MSLKLPLGLVLTTALLLAGNTAWAQSQPEPPAATYAVPAPAAVQRLYRAADPVSSLLYNGPEYVNYAMRYAARAGHQFFLTPELRPGNVFYYQQSFAGLQLRYDVVLDQVVLEQPTSPLTLRLVNEKLDRFTIADHSFERLQADSTAGGLPATGYYEVLAEGPVRLLARRTKRKQERVEGRIVTVEFILTDRLYASKAGRSYSVNSKSAVLKLLADREPEVRAFMRERKLKLLKNQFEKVALVLVNYYNQLPPR